MNPDFLIVGCTSAVGSRLLFKLLDQGYRVRGIRLNSECKVKNKNHYCESLDLLNTDPQIIISKVPSRTLLLAAWCTTPGIFWDSPLNSKWADTYKNLILAFKANGGSRIVGLGSCAEYKIDGVSALSEINVTEPDSAYGKSKLDVCRFLSQLEIDFLWVRTFFQYGPEDYEEKFIASLIIAFQKNQDYYLRDPSGRRDYVYIDDVSEVLFKLILKGSRGIFNIGTGNSVSGYEVASIAHSATGNGGRVLATDSISQAQNIFASTEKLENEIGPIKWTDVEIGIQQMITRQTTFRKVRDPK